MKRAVVVENIIERRGIVEREPDVLAEPSTLKIHFNAGLENIDAS